MCGIAGIWQRDGQRVAPGTIARFVAALAHRGPDGEGVLLADDGRLALAHRRLAILDPGPAGAQPMRSPGGRYEITYNGEVYNFLELRAELERDGVAFRSETDTEVILAAFERWGEAALLRFNGMWSFALWDHRERRLLLSRDRFGVKPLYVAVEPRRIAFASELKAFLHLDGFVPAADPETIAARLADDFAGRVLLRGVEALPPGHCLEVTPEGMRRRRWWSTLEHLTRVPDDPATRAGELRELLIDACRLRLRSDVPVATSLSGGLDSSSVVCALAEAERRAGGARRAPEWRRAFVASFPGTPQDETAYALLAADRAGVQAVVHRFAAADLRADVDAYLTQFEEIGGLFGFPAWALYREMRRAGVAVSLDGHGGDELFGGYAGDLELALLRGRGMVAAPRRTLDLLATLHGMRAHAGARELLLAALTVPGLRAVAGRLPLARGRVRALAATRPRLALPAGDAGDDDVRAEEEAIDALGPLTGALYHGFHRRSLPRVLRNFDAHAMGHGIEVRMPLLDWRIVRYAFSVSDEDKVSRGFTKRLLREAMRGVVPEPVRVRRDKVGYNAPVATWLASGLGDWLWDEVNDAAFLASELWDGRALRARVAAVRAAGTAWRPEEAHRVLLAVATHWWLTRWLADGARAAGASASAASAAARVLVRARHA